MIMTPSSPEALTISLCANHANDTVLVTLTPPDKPQGSSPTDVGKRSAVDICCVLDVSGSMAANADIKSKRTFPTPNLPGQFTVLDIVKHSVRTIVTSMQEDDRIAVVTFSDYAQVIADFTPMNAANKVKMLDSIDRLTPLNSTNLWDGLETGMDLILAAQTPPPKLPWYEQVQHNRYTSLFLLTDGMPNVNPPNGHISALRSYLDMRSPSSAHSFTIHTFGFGYSIDTPLLLDIAKTGGGGYNFIPDVGMVGTVFVNSVASAYAVYAQHVKVDVQIPTAMNGIKHQENYKMELKGKIESTKTTRGIRFESADIQYGQPKHYVLDITPAFTTSLYAFASYRAVTSSADVSTDIAVLSPSQKASKEELVEIEYRATAFTVASVLLDTTSNNRTESVATLKEIEARLTSQPGLSEHPYAAALARDVGGEALTSVYSSANYERWGKHYGKSYARAHQQQHCQNYKDSGLQSYGISPMMQRERDTLEQAFHSTPAPTPSSMPAPPQASVTSPMMFSPQLSVNSSTLSIPSISGQSTPSLDDSLGRTPSPTYREMLGQYAQYASDPSSSYLSDRSATLTRLKGFFSQRRQQQQSPLNKYGSNAYSPFGALAGLQPVSPGMQDDALITAVPLAPTTEAFDISPMSPYYDPGAPCFTGECLVRTPGGAAPIRVDELMRGITVQTPMGPRNVAAVVRTQVHRQEIELCRLGDLVITPWHPVKIQGEGGIARWVFPSHVVEPELVPCDAVYSVLLERENDAHSESCNDAHSICISDVWTVTLGHGITAMNTDDAFGDSVDVRGHRFLGDYDKVVRDLSVLNGFFKDGVVRCQGVRRGSDGMICGFVGERNFKGNFRQRASSSMNMVSV